MQGKQFKNFIFQLANRIVEDLEKTLNSSPISRLPTMMTDGLSGLLANLGENKYNSSTVKIAYIEKKNHKRNI